MTPLYKINKLLDEIRQEGNVLESNLNKTEQTEGDKVSEGSSKEEKKKYRKKIKQI